MPKIGNNKPYAQKPCDRCGSKRKVTKTWTERIENSYSFMTLYHSQVICTNKDCQKELEEVERKEKEKRDLRLAKKTNRNDMKITKTKTTSNTTTP